MDIGRKVEHVKAAANHGGHHCHWPGCGAQVKPAMWGCTRHWFMLPQHIRTAIWRAFEPGQENTKTPSARYIEVARAAQAWIAEYEKNHATPQQGKLL